MKWQERKRIELLLSSVSGIITIICLIVLLVFWVTNDQQTQTGHSHAIPVTCEKGDIFIVNSHNVYECSEINTWIQISSSKERNGE